MQWPSSVMATTPARFKSADGREFLAGDVLGDGAGDENIHDAFARRAFADERDGAGGVNRGQRVGHADDGGETAARGGGGAGGEIFLRGLARLAQMDVQINQAGADDFSAGVELFNALGRGKIFADGGNFAVNDEHVRGGIKMICGINHPSAGQQQRIHRREHSAARLTRQARHLTSFGRRIKLLRGKGKSIQLIKS